jgi:hypothetical protein
MSVQCSAWTASTIDGKHEAYRQNVIGMVCAKVAHSFTLVFLLESPRHKVMKILLIMEEITRFFFNNNCIEMTIKLKYLWDIQFTVVHRYMEI